MIEHTELQTYKIEQAKRILLDAWVDLTKVRPVLEDIEASLVPYDHMMTTLVNYSKHFENCYVEVLSDGSKVNNARIDTF